MDMKSKLIIAKKVVFIIGMFALLSLTGCEVVPNEPPKRYHLELILAPDDHEYLLLNVNGYPQLTHAEGCFRKH
jgi:hypothetical protein